MKIGILQCDSTMEHFRAEHGNYPGMFISLFHSVDPELEFEVYNVELEQFPQAPEKCEAYLITGSRYSVYDSKRWIENLEKYVLELHERKCPMLGICFGHQMVARALGGKTEAAEQGWGVGVQNYQTVSTQKWIQPALKKFSLLASHKDQVTKLPKNAELIAESDFCPYAAFRIDNHILTFQGHPEFQKAYSKALILYRQQILGPEVFEEGIKSLEQSIQPQEITHWMINFLLNGTSPK